MAYKRAIFAEIIHFARFHESHFSLNERHLTNMEISQDHFLKMFRSRKGIEDFLVKTIFPSHFRLLNILACGLTGNVTGSHLPVRVRVTPFTGTCCSHFLRTQNYKLVAIVRHFSK